MRGVRSPKVFLGEQRRLLLWLGNGATLGQGLGAALLADALERRTG